jgi:hypothetical protein
MDRWSSVRHGFMIDDRYYRSNIEIFNRWIDSIDEKCNRLYRSNTIGIVPSIHRRLSPAMPFTITHRFFASVPNNGLLQTLQNFEVYGFKLKGRVDVGSNGRRYSEG